RVCLMGGGAGMYYIQQCMRHWNEQGLRLSYPALTKYALAHRTDRFFAFDDVPDAALDMPQALNAAIQRAGFASAESPYELYAVFCNSLARLTTRDLIHLEGTLGRKFERVYIVSGGAQADAVNLSMADMLDRPIYAGLTEAAATGNLLAQLSALGAIKDKQQAITAVKNITEMRRFGK
ncbi:MAG: hypothetical protein RR482_10450, partial [Clostridia bacterium]